MEMILLEAKVRDPKISPSYLRKTRLIPAVYYGHKEKSVALQLDYQTFRKTFQKAGGNQVVELQIDGKKKPVLIHEVQYNPLTDRIDHVDFLHINMDKEVTAMIPVEIVGLAPAVKDFGGILTTLKHQIEVRCLPANLPHSIQVDVSSLAQLHSSIHIRDLVLPKDVKVHGSPADVVLTVAPPKIQEELAKEAAAAAAAAPVSTEAATTTETAPGAEAPAAGTQAPATPPPTAPQK